VLYYLKEESRRVVLLGIGSRCLFDKVFGSSGQLGNGSARNPVRIWLGIELWCPGLDQVAVLGWGGRR